MIYPKHWPARVAYIVLITLTSVIYLDIPVFRQNTGVAESIICAAIAFACLIYHLWAKPKHSFSAFEIAGIGFFLYAAMAGIFNNTFDTRLTARIALLIFVYFTIKSLLKSGQLSTCILPWTVLIILIAYLVVWLTRNSEAGDAVKTLFIPNASIFSILLASQLALIIPFLARALKKRKPYTLVLALATIIGLSIVLLITTGGRAGWIGFLVAMLFLVHQNLLTKKTRRRFVIAGVLVCLGFVSILLAYKQGSTNGRILIYKISTSILKNHFLFGIGQGQFKTQYNNCQAAYFASYDINSKEALLADDTYYAFNDFWQLLLETGITGFTIFAVAIILLLRQLIKTLSENPSSAMITGAIASLICITIGSLFSYALQIFPIIIQCVICFALLSAKSGKQQIQSISGTHPGLIKMATSILLIVLTTHFIYLANYKAQQSKAYELSRTGFKAEALAKYKTLCQSYSNDGFVLYSYAAEAYAVNEIENANQALNEARQLYSSNKLYKLAAQAAETQKDYTQAENYYKQAVYIIPSRMASRFELFSFYLRRNDTTNIRHWGRSILMMPVKLPSARSFALQKRTARILHAYQ